MNGSVTRVAPGTLPRSSKYFSFPGLYYGPMEMGSRVSAIGALLGDPVRAAMLTTLIDGRSLPAGELAFIGNVAPQTASFHLGKLLELQLIAVERQGKHKYYRLASEQVALAIESLASLAPRPGRLQSPCNQDLRFARSCYKHLAGSLSIQIHNALSARGFVLEAEPKQYALTAEGARWLAELSPSAHGALSRQAQRGRFCLDWTERRPHIGGPLGAALLSRLIGARWLASRSGTRALRLTFKGREGLERRFGLCFNPLSL